MPKSTREKLIKYMVIHKKTTFQSIAGAIPVNPDRLYDIVNGKPVKPAVDDKVRKWLKKHKKDPEKVRFI